MVTVAEMVASSVLITGADASTVMDSCTEPGDSVKSLRTIWLMLTMLPVCFNDETGVFRGNVVGADADEVDPVVSVLIRDGAVLVERGGIDGRDFGAGDGLAAGIGDGPDQRSDGGDLPVRSWQAASSTQRARTIFSWETPKC